MKIVRLALSVLGICCTLILIWHLIQHHKRATFERRLAARIELAADQNDELINLSALTPFLWERVFFFCPYTSSEQIGNALGRQWTWASLTGIETSEGFFLIVFIRSNRVVQHCMFPRNKGDFDIPAGQASMAVDNAVFKSMRKKFKFRGASFEWLVVEPLLSGTGVTEIEGNRGESPRSSIVSKEAFAGTNRTASVPD